MWQPLRLLYRAFDGHAQPVWKVGHDCTAERLRNRADAEFTTTHHGTCVEPPPQLSVGRCQPLAPVRGRQVPPGHWPGESRYRWVYLLLDEVCAFVCRGTAYPVRFAAILPHDCCCH